jgi:hypothetical protein
VGEIAKQDGLSNPVDPKRRDGSSGRHRTSCCGDLLIASNKARKVSAGSHNGPGQWAVADLFRDSLKGAGVTGRQRYLEEDRLLTDIRSNSDLPAHRAADGRGNRSRLWSDGHA